MGDQMLISNRVFSEHKRIYGSLQKSESEKIEKDIVLIRRKISDREYKNDPNQTIFFSAFSEFGSEVLPILYSIPRVNSQYPSMYKIAVGWSGREYMYRHLVDEYWEIHPDFSWLREYCRAYHHDSKNLTNLESKLAKQGRLFTFSKMGQEISQCNCSNCFHAWQSRKLTKRCPKCKSEDLQQSLMSNPLRSKRDAVWIPEPSKDKVAEISSLLGNNPVAIFQRSRQCYGRNLSPEFYADLVRLVKDKGFDPVILGEPGFSNDIDGCLNLTNDKRMSDIEYTFAVVKRCLFTLQFWTASTRIAGLQGVPYIIFESPDQIWGKLEHHRRMLCDRGPSKLIASDYCATRDDPNKTLDIVDGAINRVVAGDYSDMIGIVSSIKSTDASKILFRNKMVGIQ